jgi:GntR family transcriptional repressor for pyruvate dehydrogenase complex
MPRVQRLHATQEAFADLLKLLKAGDFKVGDLLPPERVLAERFNVSRMSIREATKKLEQRGMLSVRQGIGVRVIDQPSLPLQEAFSSYLGNEHERLVQSVETRLLIEPELAARAAKDPRSDDLRRLKEIHESIRLAPDIRSAVEIDIRFHEQIADMAHNQLLALILASLAELGRASRERTITNVGIDRAHQGHGEIFAAIKARNPAMARRKMHGHLEGILEDLPNAE